MAFKAPSWLGNHVTNRATARWMGRNRPAIGGGATVNVGATQSPDPAQVRPAGQGQMPANVMAQSFNPHAPSPNYTIGGDSLEIEHHDGAHAPANKSFVGLGIAPVSAFR